jgi:hypothetical protein
MVSIGGRLCWDITVLIIINNAIYFEDVSMQKTQRILRNAQQNERYRRVYRVF